MSEARALDTFSPAPRPPEPVVVRPSGGDDGPALQAVVDAGGVICVGAPRPPEPDRTAARCDNYQDDLGGNGDCRHCGGRGDGETHTCRSVIDLRCELPDGHEHNEYMREHMGPFRTVWAKGDHEADR
jgi:hypothetical protein